MLWKSNNYANTRKQTNKLMNALRSHRKTIYLMVRYSTELSNVNKRKAKNNKKRLRLPETTYITNIHTILKRRNKRPGSNLSAGLAHYNF